MATPAIIAQADRAGQGGGQGLEVGDFAGGPGVVVIAANQAEAVGQAAQIDEAKVERKDEGGNDQPQHHEGHLRVTAGDRGREQDDPLDPAGQGCKQRLDALVKSNRGLFGACCGWETGGNQ